MQMNLLVVRARSLFGEKFVHFSRTTWEKDEINKRFSFASRKDLGCYLFSV